jgi:phenylalanyl-tRNA synthetase beta chain
MRTSLLPGLLEAVARARRHGERDARLFTVGAVYLPAARAPQGRDPGVDLPEERMALAAVLAGDRPAYLSRSEPVDAWDAKGLAEGIVSRLACRSATVRALSPAPKHLHPRGAAAVYVEDKQVGVLGPLHPDVAEATDTGADVVVVEIDLARLAEVGRGTPRYAPIPRFPASTRDLALVVPDAVPAGDVEVAVREAAGALAQEVRLFDRFVGGNVPPEHASLAFHVVYRAEDRTLTDAEVDEQHARVIAEVGRRFGAHLRQ